jgi:hypothetical protein
MCECVDVMRLAVKSRTHREEHVMHPDIAYKMMGQRHNELVAEAAHKRPVRESRQAGGLTGRHHTTRRWWWALQPRHA